MASTIPELISSSKNQHIQLVRELLTQRSARREQNQFVIEGVRLCEEGLNTGHMPTLVLYSEACSPRGLEMVQKAQDKGCQVLAVKQDVLEGVSNTETSQGLLMVLARSDLPLPESPDFVLVLDQVRDPGNLGTLLRSAVAAGVQAVFCTPGSVDIWSPKVVRSAMGAHFHLPIREMPWQDIARMCKANSPQLATHLAESEGGTPLWQADFSHPLALVIGGEADGASPEVKRGVDSLVNIPMPGGFESLNAAVAASILLFEVVRQRHP